MKILTSQNPFDIARADILSSDAQMLIHALNEELTIRYPEEGANHFELDPEEVLPSRGAFLIARRGGEPVGCAAVRLTVAGTAEVKRMYVTLAQRRQGLGARLLEAVEACALTLGVRRLVLETGNRQPESLALYRRFGFVEIEPFGPYINSPLSVCMCKELVA